MPDVDDRMEPWLLDAFAALREEASVPPRPLARYAAAVAAGRAASEDRHAGWLRLRARRGRLRAPLGAGLVSLAAGVVIVLGWSAPPGSPLHDVRLAREHVVTLFFGDSPSRELAYAEDRFRDAGSGANPRASLLEASAMLNSIQSRLPSSADDPVRIRWLQDQQLIMAALAGPEGSAGGGDSNSGGAADPAGGGSSRTSTAEPGDGKEPATTPPAGDRAKPTTTPESGSHRPPSPSAEADAHRTPPPSSPPGDRPSPSPSSNPTPGRDGDGQPTQRPPRTG